MLLHLLTAANVKVFGCRPDDGAATRSEAGVRKPPREETALGERVPVPRARPTGI